MDKKSVKEFINCWTKFACVAAESMLREDAKGKNWTLEGIADDASSFADLMWTRLCKRLEEE